MQSVLSACCGCQPSTPRQNRTFPTAVDYFKTYTPDTNPSWRRVIFPIFGETDSTTLHGMFFAPMYSLEEGIFLTTKVKPSETLNTLLAGIISLFPLLLICLLMALIAGFIGWLLVSIFSVNICGNVIWTSKQHCALTENSLFSI